jgi:hypothetical protein
MAPASAQSLTYAITWKDKPVGKIHAVKKSADQKSQYTFNSHVTVTVLKEFNVHTSFQSHYMAGCLQQASVQNKVNGKLKSHTQTHKQGNRYLVNKDGTEATLEVTGIEHSLTTLYFQEPVRLTQVFSERHALFLPIKSVSAHRYAIVLPDGNTNYYTYVDGICTLVEVQDGWFTFSFTLLHKAN